VKTRPPGRGMTRFEPAERPTTLRRRESARRL